MAKKREHDGHAEAVAEPDPPAAGQRRTRRRRQRAGTAVPTGRALAR
ncbi:hypothetical protein [Streptoalloteichus hindustanus]|uniref:Uncharacterized protein n=1 Tax=Streptoalloteichus hindustanus TaxID=2017 RepID=A0A1M4XIQ7_STRHI|nr:hypothetical protein [Streptoalloteichus hindustanus]SHE93052.1 hypothetical protein SAMN05444320_1028 [Streptoalloteichus hindustanus]